MSPVRAKLRVAAVPAVIATLFLSACAGADEDPAGGGSSDGPIKVAVMADRSGSLAFFGQRAQQGWDLARTAVGGKVAGRDVEYINVQCMTPADCAADTDRVIREQGADIVMGTPGSALALSISQAAARNRVVYFETASLVNALLPEGDAQYVFRAGPDETMLQDGVQPAIEAYYTKAGGSFQGAKALLVNESSAANHNAAELQRGLLGEMGVQVVDQFEYEVKSTDFAPLAARIASTNPDILVETSYVADMISLNTELAQRDYRPKLHVIVGAPAPKEQGEALDANYLQGIVHVTFPSLDVKEEGAKGITEFLDLYQKEFGAAPTDSYPLTYYTSARILFDALEANGGKTDPESFKAALTGLDKPVGSYANGWGVKFDAHGQNTRAEADVVQWQGGKVCTVLPAEAAPCQLLVVS